MSKRVSKRKGKKTKKDKRKSCQTSSQQTQTKFQSIHVIYFSTASFAFCSIVYELLLGQAMAAFLGNTVLRFSVTIGLYLCSMGLGAFLAEEKFIKNPFGTLLRTELLLVILGGLSIIHLHIINILFGNSEIVFKVFSHLLIVTIGVMTGFELPALIEIYHQSKSYAENKILGFSYTGAFLGTLAFAFWFYPKIGLMSTSFIVGILNIITCLLLLSRRKTLEMNREIKFQPAFIYYFLLLFIMLIFIFHSGEIESFFMVQYVSS